MSLANYTALQASIASWMNRTDLTAVIPDFVTITESKIARDLRLRNQLASTTLAVVGSVREVALPTGWLEFESVSIAGTPDSYCQYVTSEFLDSRFPNGSYAGKPGYFTVQGTNIVFGPFPDAAYTANASYYAAFAALSTANANWLLTNAPNVYLYGCLREGAFFTKDSAGAAQWDGLYKQEVKTLQDADDKANHSGSAMRVRNA